MIQRLRASFDSVLLEVGRPSEEEIRIRDRRRRERDRRFVIPGRPLVLVEASWYNQWMDFLRGDLQIPPGPVDNEPLMAGVTPAERHPGPDSRLFVDYYLLDAGIWEEIVVPDYGGGPRIDVTDLTGHLYTSMIREIRSYLVMLIEVHLQRARREGTDPLLDGDVEEEAFFAFDGDLAEVDGDGDDDLDDIDEAEGHWAPELGLDEDAGADDEDWPTDVSLDEDW